MNWKGVLPILGIAIGCGVVLAADAVYVGIINPYMNSTCTVSQVSECAVYLADPANGFHVQPDDPNYGSYLNACQAGGWAEP